MSNNHALIFFLSHFESYMRIGPVVNYPETVDYILERNFMNCQQTKMAVITLNCQNLCPNAILLKSRMSETSIQN